jgi:aconitate hydratase
MELVKLSDIKGARLLAKLGDSITTDHISPAGNIATGSPAATYLNERGINKKDYNSYGSRRGNHEIMMRGTFANIRIKNQMAPGTEGGFTTFIPTNEIMTIYDAAMKYKELDTPLVVIAGKEYGTGSSRDWAAKGTLLLGVKVVIAESFERIHRSNLVRMGVIPLEFENGDNAESFKLTGYETFDIIGLHNDMEPRCDIKCKIIYQDGKTKEVTLKSRVDTLDELKYLTHGGILQNVIRDLI